MNFLAVGKLPDGYLETEYVAQQFVERLVHYVLSVPAGSYTMAQLSHLLEQLDPRAQVFFFKRLKETRSGEANGRTNRSPQP